LNFSGITRYFAHVNQENPRFHTLPMFFIAQTQVERLTGYQLRQHRLQDAETETATDTVRKTSAPKRLLQHYLRRSSSGAARGFRQLSCGRQQPHANALHPLAPFNLLVTCAAHSIAV
jgi:hypothetical protein